MSDPNEYAFTDVKDIPKKTTSRGSKYDIILDDFLASDKQKVKVLVPEITGSYLASQLAKRLSLRAAEKLPVEISSVSNICYLRRIVPQK